VLLAVTLCRGRVLRDARSLQPTVEGVEGTGGIPIGVEVML